MRKIALIMDGWKRFFTYAWPAGILQRIKETNEDVNLYIFNSSGDWSLDKDYNIGEYNIYRLPDLNDFDGIILDLNNVRFKEVRDYAISAAKQTNKPVISIANELEDFYYVGIDNYAAMQEVIEHLYQKHNCRRFWFIMGDEDNYENRVRVRALKDYMEDHQLECRDEDFYYESYEYRCGYSGFQSLYVSHSQELPDAVICANDNIAVGVCEAVLEAGYQVPKDLYVTGFDDFDKARYYSPQISTVSHIREEVGYECMEIFLKLWEGDTVPRFNYTRTKCIFTESCGCSRSLPADYFEHSKEQIMYGIETTDFEEQILSFEYELMQCRTVKEMTCWIPKCIPSMNCDAMYLVLDEHMNDFRRQGEDYDRHLLEDEGFRICGYPEQMNLEFVYERGESRTEENTPISSLFPIFESEKGGTDFLFMPLHFRNRTVGYFVIRNAVYLMEKQYLFKVINSLTTAMENLHKKEMLEYMNQVLSDLYVKDAMTGLYNWLGYQKLACRLFAEKKRKKENLLIMFLDMDRLKYINDHFGHEYGDFAIKTISQAILHFVGREAIPVRLGGDEFLVIHNVMPKSEMETMINAIQDEILRKAEQMKFPFELTVSIGVVITDMEEEKTLDDYIREADEVMYAAKVAKKAERRD